MVSSGAHFGSFVLYLGASWLLLLQLLRLASHRKHFFHLVPFVAIYAALAAFLLCYFGLRDFFWWYVGPTSFFFLAMFGRHLGSRDGVDAFAALQAQVVDAVPEGEIRQQVERELSPKRAIAQHVIASAIVFVAAFWLTTYLLNAWI
jgi:hypothetical protein